MISVLKSWISTLLCLGIFITFIKLVIPKTNLRKYIYSLIGIITIIAIISPVINLLKNGDVESGISNVIANLDTSNNNKVSADDIKNKKDEAVRNDFIQSLKNDIKSKLSLQNVTVDRVEIFLDNDYNIKKIEIHIKKINSNTATTDNVTKVVKYVNSQYDIEYSKIIVIEEAD